MTSPAKDIADLLQTQGVGTVGTNIYVGTIPDTSDAPEECIGVFDTGDLFTSPKWKRDEHTIQVLVRSGERDYAGGYTLAKAVKDALLGIPPQTVNSKSYVLFVMIGGINHLNNDQRDRARFSLNFKVVVENVSGGVRESF